jgi:hypothetical protein
MEQRPLRLGDLVDDYCPRERRVTNHAIVAIVNDSIRQTRCAACDVEHVFKGGKPPRRRTKRDAGDEPVEPVDNSGGQLVAPTVLSAAESTLNGQPETPRAHAAEPAAVTTPNEPPSPVDGPQPEEPELERPASDADNSTWHGHRPLIRAQLPRSDSDVPPPRPIPEFTIYQRHHGRGGGGFRQARGWGERNGNTANGNGNGNGFGYGGNGGRGERRSGPGFGGPGPGQGQGRRRHGKKRPR